MRPITSTLIVIVAFVFALPSFAQNPFSPAVRVNDRVITQYELSQRLRFMTVLRTPGANEELARNILIEDRLKQDALAAAGITLTDEEIETGMEEFSSRANMDLQQFTRALGQAGVDRETFRDFVEVGLGWRNYARLRFGPRAQVGEDEIDRRIALASNRGGLRVLLTEIVLPNTPQFANQTQRRVQQIERITTEAAFSAAARDFSVSPTRTRGGRLDWLPLSNLPPQLRQVVLSLQPGEISAPVVGPNAILIFQLRAIEETDAEQPEIAALDFATFYIAGGDSDAARSEAARIRAQIDTCDDLFSIAKDLPPERLEREVLPPSEIPQDVGMELAKLDPGEVSATLTRGDALMLLMLCGRTPELGQEINREAIRNALVNERIASLSEGFLAELRADAVIVTP
ncbi:peptidylprolyl isomerase [Parasulfitobacter algicola]|uniref:Parvulin-like PPIase n=1 Tax=Parasulfitobacter algicola TaxID=2614809 RepID=A0ABX2IT51_9RHOB|nr:peptidylprolyl isomerase [Sulfitobacter algicola]NSX55725.1 peptidylprolyl isomerase [Sulfitobacter algicola]